MSLNKNNEKFNYKLIVMDDMNQSYQTKIYSEVKAEIFIKKGVPQKDYEEVLKWFFYQDSIIPLKEKKSIKEIHVYYEMRIFAVFSEKHEKMFSNLKYIAQNTGWYFYITGIKLEEDEITEFIENSNISIRALELSWELSQKLEVFLDPIGTEPNKNAYLVKIIDDKSANIKNILLDAGIDETELLKLKTKTETLDLIFVSHAHRDHTNGLLMLSNSYPNTPIVCSRTTFEFFLLYNWRLFLQLKNGEIVEDKLLNNIFFVKNEDFINIDDDNFFKFFYAGHMPGALMLFFKIHEFSFLYSGDFNFYDNFPIAGVRSNLERLPQKIDFLLVDGAFSDTQFDAPSYIFDGLRYILGLKAKYRNKVLIGADYGSTALVLFFTIFRFFRSLQRAKGSNVNRPSIYLSTRLKRFFQIMTYNKDDLHPYFKNLILTEHNPFQSAVIKWISSYSDLVEGLSEKGGIFILDPPDLTYGWIQKAFEVISQDKNNLIYLSGALRSQVAIELTSGNNNIQFENPKNGKSYQINNKAEIWNRENPNVILNLHADSIQLEKLIEHLLPSQICFFQQDPRKLVKIRNYLKGNSEKFGEVLTSAVYRHHKREMLIYSDIRKYDMIMKS